MLSYIRQKYKAFYLRVPDIFFIVSTANGAEPQNIPFREVISAFPISDDGSNR